MHNFIFGKTLNNVKRMLRDESGSFAVYFAVGMLGVFSIISITLDYEQLKSAELKLQLIADNAVMNATNAEIELGSRNSYFSDTVELLAATDSRFERVDSHASAEMDENIMTVSGNISADVKTLFIQNLGIQPRISVDSQVIRGFQSLEVALVIDISSSMDGSRIEEAKVAAKEFIELLLNDPVLSRNVIISIVPFGGTVRIPESMSFMVDDTSLLSNPDVQALWIDSKWNQCLYFDEDVISDPILPTDRFGIIADTWTYRASGANPWCPIEGGEMVLPTEDSDLLLSSIDTMQLSDGTGTDHGIRWGRAMLSHEWQGVFPGVDPDYPKPNTTDYQKVIVVMSDGGVTGQTELQTTPDADELPPFHTRDIRVKSAKAQAAFFDQCTQAKADGIQIFTIGYQVTRANHIASLEGCASSSSRAYTSDSGDLTSVFTDVANAISPTRLTD